MKINNQLIEKEKQAFKYLTDSGKAGILLTTFEAVEMMVGFNESIVVKNLNIKSLPSAIILAEKFTESKREHVVKCRIEKGSIANLGLYLGFIEGYNYVIEELKRGNVL